jgi:uncharacterized protein
MSSVIFEIESAFRSSYQLHRLVFGKGSPCVAIVAGLHGNELNGIHALNLIASVLQMQQLKGTVMLLPLINSFGADESNKRFPFDNMDINKCFPGDPNGTPSQRIAYAILEGTTDADVCIDVHSGASHIRELPQVRTPFSGKELELACSMKLPVVWRRSEEHINISGLIGAWRQRGHKALHVIGGRGMTLDSTLATKMADGITHLLSHMGIMIAMETGQTLADVSSKEVDDYRATCGGFFVPEVRVGDRVLIGRLLGYIQSPIGGSRLFEVRAKCSGIVISLRANPMIYQNELLVRIAIK